MALRQLIHLVEHSRRMSWRNERTTARREEEDRPPRRALGGFAVTLSACLRPAASALFWFLIQAQGLAEQLGHRQQVVGFRRVGFFPGLVALLVETLWRGGVAGATVAGIPLDENLEAAVAGVVCRLGHWSFPFVSVPAPPIGAYGEHQDRPQTGRSVPVKRETEGPSGGSRLGSFNGPSAASASPSKALWRAGIGRKEAAAGHWHVIRRG